MKMVRTVISAATATAKSELMNNKYEEAVKTLNTLQTNAQTLEKIRSERDKYAHLNIPNMLKFAERVGISEAEVDGLNVVHISGTKGKGSTCAFCESILRSHGYKTGFYSSPHLVEVRERFRIDGRPIQRDTFASYFWDVYSKLDETKELYEGKMPNYFGFLTVMALHVFLQEKVDVAIMEVGIGGQYDCTNMIKHPVVCGVSSLGLDHTSILGTSIDKIAWHKAGIFKPGVPAFTAPQHEKAMEVLKNRAVEIGVPLSVCPDLKSYNTSGRQFHLGIKGSMQQVNASLALQIANLWISKAKGATLPSQGGQKEEEVIKTAETFQLSSQMLQGLEHCSWLGRNQKLVKPGVTYYLDGAHTVESIQQCVEWFQAEMCLEKKKRKKGSYKVLIFNTTGDRDTKVLLEPLQGCDFDAVLFCPNVAFLSSNSADQTNRTVTKESQINRCLVNKHAWESLIQESNEKNQDNPTNSKVDHAVKNHGSVSSMKNQAVNGNVMVNHDSQGVNGVPDADTKAQQVVSCQGSAESVSQDGPTSVKRLRSEEAVLNGHADQHNSLSERLHKDHVKDLNSNCNHYISNSNGDSLECKAPVIHAFPSISHCVDWVMRGRKLRDISVEGGQLNQAIQSTLYESENELGKAELEDSDEALPEIGEKDLHILVTGSLHLVGGALRVIEGENLCA